MDRFHQFQSSLKKKRKTFFGFLFSDIGITTLAIVIQLVLIWSAYTKLLNYIVEIYAIVVIVELFTVFNILNHIDNSDVKTTWIVVCFLMPLLGSFIYFYTFYDIFNYRSKKRLSERFRRSDEHIVENEEALQYAKQYPSVIRLHNYLKNNGSIGIYHNSQVIYFKNGELFLEDYLSQIRKAKNFIFLEYFIIEEGYLWDRILEILIEKMNQGVEVKIIYDGSCDFKKLPRNYFKYLNSLGIKTVKFSPIYPLISLQFNFRDHRKITIIDGQTAYVGGMNLADEYVNRIHPYSYWKDTAVRIDGEAVKSLTLMFLQMFSFDQQQMDFSYLYASEKEIAITKGIVIPFADGPIDSYLVGETVYMDIINSAQNYIYIMTPYLILDSNLEKALISASSKGVDVRIILPKIPDKKYIYLLGLACSKRLMQANIKIYQYQYGFLHAKQVIADDQVAVVGTINFDYRSLYHNYECGIYLYDVDCLEQIKQDFDATIGSSHLIRSEELSYLNRLRYRLLIGVMKIFEPLL